MVYSIAEVSLSVHGMPGEVWLIAGHLPLVKDWKLVSGFKRSIYELCFTPLSFTLSTVSNTMAVFRRLTSVSRTSAGTCLAHYFVLLLLIDTAVGRRFDSIDNCRDRVIAANATTPALNLYIFAHTSTML